MVKSRKKSFPRLELQVRGLSEALYNLKFINGGKWLGRTHLAHAIGNRAFRENSRLSVHYTTADKLSLKPYEYNKSLDLITADDLHMLLENIDVQIQLLIIAMS